MLEIFFLIKWNNQTRDHEINTSMSSLDLILIHYQENGVTKHVPSLNEMTRVFSSVLYESIALGMSSRSSLVTRCDPVYITDFVLVLNNHLVGPFLQYHEKYSRCKIRGFLASLKRVNSICSCCFFLDWWQMTNWPKDYKKSFFN